jgi:hypothetical protein
MITVKTKVYFTRGKAGRRRITEKAPATQLVHEGRTPRISKVMALAIKFDGLLRDGSLTDMTEIARLAMVTQPRITQIMNLLHLAVDIQEELLFLPRVMQGRDAIHEKLLRSDCAEMDWEKQRVMWRRIRETEGAWSALSSQNAASRSSDPTKLENPAQRR